MSKENIKITMTIAEVEKLLIKECGIQMDFTENAFVRSNLTHEIILEFVSGSVKTSNKPVFNIADYDWIDTRYDDAQKEKILNTPLKDNFLSGKRFERLYSHLKNESDSDSLKIGDFLKFSWKQMLRVRSVGKMAIYDLDRAFKVSYGLKIRE